MIEKKDSETNQIQISIDPSKLFKKKPLAKIGLIITILSIVGLIVSFTVPWAFVDFKDSGLDADETVFGHDLENEDDIHLAQIFTIGGFFGSDVTDYTGFIDGTPVMADFGFILMTIVGLFLIAVSLFEEGKTGFFSKFLKFSKKSVLLVAIIPALMVFLAGVRFVGLNVNTVLNYEVLEDSFLEDLVLVFPAAYIVLVFGLVFFVLIFLTVKPDVKSVVKLKDMNKKKGSLVLNAQRFALVFVFLSVIGLVFMPLLPWVATPAGKDTVYLHEDDIMLNGEMAEDLEDDLEDYKSQNRYFSRYSDYGFDNYFSSAESKMDKTEDYLESMIGLKDNLSGIGMFFWFSLIFSILILIGAEMFSLGEKYQLFSHIMFILGIVVLLASILILVNHLWFIGNIGVFAESYEDLFGSDEISFGFNYFPLLAALGLLISSIFYMLMIFSASLNSFLYTINKKT